VGHCTVKSVLFLVFVAIYFCATAHAGQQRIISLTLPSSQILDALGLETAVVGVDKFTSKWIPTFRNTPVLSGITTFSLERIISLKPTLLVFWWYQDIPVELLSRQGIKCISYQAKTTYDIYRLITAISLETGLKEQGQRFIRTLKEREKKLRDNRPGIRPLIYAELETGKTAGPGTFTDSLIRLGGGQNAGASFWSDYPMLSNEQIIHLNPDIILLIRNDEKTEELSNRPGWKKINAVRSGCIFRIPQEIVTPGPRFIEGAEFINRCIGTWRKMQNLSDCGQGH
jgi:iron complex transport system substrate-binding protein